MYKVYMYIKRMAYCKCINAKWQVVWKAIIMKNLKNSII